MYLEVNQRRRIFRLPGSLKIDRYRGTNGEFTSSIKILIKQYILMVY